MDIKQFIINIEKFEGKKTIDIKDFGTVNSILKFYENNKSEIAEELSPKQKNLLLHLLFIHLTTNQKLVLSNFFDIIDSKENFLKSKEIYKNGLEEKLKILENQLVNFDEADMYFLQTVNVLEKDLIENTKMLSTFLDKIPYYFDNYEDNIVLVLKHLLNKELSIKLESKLFQLVSSNIHFAKKYGLKSFEIVKSVIIDDDVISKFENLLNLNEVKVE